MTEFHLLLFSSLMSAKAITWEVKPTVCVTQKPGDACIMQVDILLSRPIDASNCLYFDKDLLACWPDNEDTTKVDITLSDKGLLTLNQKNGEPLADQMLTVKSREATNRRRRVRQPWSLF